MKNADVNYCSENGLDLTQVLNLSIHFSLSPNITRIAFFCTLRTGFDLEGLAPLQTDTPYEKLLSNKV